MNVTVAGGKFGSITTFIVNSCFEAGFFVHRDIQSLSKHMHVIRTLSGTQQLPVRRRQAIEKLSVTCMMLMDICETLMR